MKRLGVATLIIVSGAGIFFAFKKPAEKADSLAEEEAKKSELPRREGRKISEESPHKEEQEEKPLSLDELPPHVKRAAEEVLSFARAAKLYNLDPRITAFRDDRTPYRKPYQGEVTNVLIGTPTHNGSFIRGRLNQVYSLYDGSDERRRPEVVKEWYKCTGTWTKEEAIKEALAILERFGDSETLQAVLPGKKEYIASEMGNVARTPDGQPTKVRPFHRVRLFDTNGSRRVEFEFRMGSTGVVGVTKFWRWP